MHGAIFGLGGDLIQCRSLEAEVVLTFFEFRPTVSTVLVRGLMRALIPYSLSSLTISPSRCKPDRIISVIGSAFIFFS
jgi:hypothetical protein